MAQTGKQAKLTPGTKFDKEAKYYLEENNWDYKKALEEYKTDLQVEVEMYKQFKLDDKNNKNKKDKCITF